MAEKPVLGGCETKKIRNRKKISETGEKSQKHQNPYQTRSGWSETRKSTKSTKVAHPCNNSEIRL